MMGSLLTRLHCSRLLLAGSKLHHALSAYIFLLSLDYRDHIDYQFRYSSSIFVPFLPHTLQRLSAMFLGQLLSTLPGLPVPWGCLVGFLIGFSSFLRTHNSGNISAESMKSYHHIRHASFVGTGAGHHPHILLIPPFPCYRATIWAVLLQKPSFQKRNRY